MMDLLQQRTMKEVSNERPSPLNGNVELDSPIDTTGDYFESLLAAAARATAAGSERIVAPQQGFVQSEK